MKVCILSMQKVQNFGSLLQSYSLKKIIESLGHEVSFIDIEPIPEDDKLLMSNRQGYDCEKEKYSKNKVIRFISKVDKYFFNRIKIRKLSNEQDKIFEEFRIKYLNIKEESNYGQYDICVIGSDEVFNCLTKSNWGFTSQLFGNVKQAKRVITYAASCGSTSFDLLPKQVGEKIKNVFKDVCAFSVRDKNTEIFVKSLSDKEVNVHFDPVIVGNLDSEINAIENINNLPEHYCVVYAYYNRVYKPEEIDGLIKFCNKHNLKIIAAGAPQMWIKDYYVLNPFQLLKLFEKADFIYTDTFHGTIFASKYASKFAVISRESNKNKLLDLVFKLGVDKHLIDNISEIDKTYNIINDFEKNRKICENAYKNTINYLKENI